ncbi:MAG TPA: PIG-L family deacetylase [Alphaproteobacteria bacterium]|nr:PIG-L family deacetylase [Alphaproteobacteria bacterium]
MTAPRRILVLVPHPDDEVVGCGIAARRQTLSGKHVLALYLTTGVPERELLWPWQRRHYESLVAARRAEAEAAAELLGIMPAGFQDVPARTLKSHLASSLAHIEATLAAERIGELWTPAFEGGHQDHDATNLLASRLRHRLPVIEFPEYHLAGGRVASQRFLAASGEERHLVLTHAEAALKRQALALYRSERRNLAHVRCERECLRPLALYDYARAPHVGRLFYARFQWVPFRHPRVDFDPPARVYSALARFAAETSASAEKPTEVAER